MQPMINIQDSQGNTIVFTRDRAALLDALKNISTGSVEHLRIVEEFEKNELRFNAKDWLKREINRSPKTLCRAIKQLIKKYHQNIEVKSDLLNILKMEQGAL